VLYLGEINDSQRESWCEVIEAFDEATGQTTPFRAHLQRVCLASMSSH
jgi:hypothetical protein